MKNITDLTQPNNQEIIVEEINEEELEGVVGGGFLTNFLASVGFILDGTLLGAATGIGGVTQP